MPFSNVINRALSKRHELGYLGHSVWPLFDARGSNMPQLGDIIRIDGRQATTVKQSAESLRGSYGVGSGGAAAGSGTLGVRAIQYGISLNVGASSSANIEVEGIKLSGKRSIEFTSEYGFLLESDNFYFREIPNAADYAARLWDAMKSKRAQPQPLDYLVYSVVEVERGYFMGSSQKGLSVSVEVDASVAGMGGGVKGTAGFNESRQELKIWDQPDRSRATVALLLLRWGRAGKVYMDVRSS